MLEHSVTTDQALKKSCNFLMMHKYFTHCVSMNYTENLGLQDCVGVLQIQSHIDISWFANMADNQNIVVK